MASEETILENAPVTPAHKFAWRAFKGFVYGSPESPEHIGKENMLPTRLSPQKRVSIDVASLSPQKRKLELQVSPTKSILRTPGAPTPRAQSLRDMNVTFKSLSPESQLTQTSAVAVLEQQVDSLWQELEQSLDITNAQPKPKRVTSETRTKKQRKPEVLPDTPPAPSLAPPTTANADQDAYARRTEKEVKRLLRQHKKLRDYARRVDDQNVELQVMVEDLQRENARLRNKLSKQDGHGEGRSARPNDELTSRPRMDERLDNKDSKQHKSEKVAATTTQDVSISRTEAFKRSLRGEDPGTRSKAISQPQPHALTRQTSAASLSAAKNEHPPAAAQPPEPNPIKSSKTPQDPHYRIKSAQIPPTAPYENKKSPLTHPSQSNTSIQPPSQRPRSPLSLTLLAAHLEPTPRPLAKNSSAGHASPQGTALAPDRVAAARLRLARKREGRGRGVGRGTGVGTALGGGLGSGAVGEGESAVDWGAL